MLKYIIQYFLDKNKKRKLFFTFLLMIVSQTLHVSSPFIFKFITDGMTKTYQITQAAITSSIAAGTLIPHGTTGFFAVISQVNKLASGVKGALTLTQFVKGLGLYVAAQQLSNLLTEW